MSPAFIFGLMGRFILHFCSNAALVIHATIRHRRLAMNPDDLQHGLEYHRDSGDLAGAYVTEKMDGVRVRFDGKSLWTRQGCPLRAPDWFTKGLPAVPLDCELWGGYQNRRAVNALMASKVQDWSGMKLWVFDAPDVPGDYAARHDAMTRLDLGGCAEVVPMHVLFSMDALPTMLASVTSRGGEGLMLHRSGASYAPGRSNRLLKFKPAHLPEFHVRDVRAVAV